MDSENSPLVRGVPGNTRRGVAYLHFIIGDTSPCGYSSGQRRTWTATRTKNPRYHFSFTLTTKKIAIWRFFNLPRLPQYVYGPHCDDDLIRRVRPWLPCVRGIHAYEYGVFLTVDMFFLLPFQILLCVYLIISFIKTQLFYLLFINPSFCSANNIK